VGIPDDGSARFGCVYGARFRDSMVTDSIGPILFNIDRIGMHSDLVG
jgi:hypothetical protein